MAAVKIGQRGLCKNFSVTVKCLHAELIGLEADEPLLSDNLHSEDITLPENLVLQTETGFSLLFC